MIDQAREFAVAFHAEQKYGDEPYSFHLDAVAAIAKPFGHSAQVIAYLHDVVEDTSATVQDIEAKFGNSVAVAVAILTDEPGANRKERKSKTYAKMANVTSENNVALIVKAADRLANMKACLAQSNERLLAVYRSEHAVFKASVYRPDLCDDLWTELDAIYVA